MIISNHFQVAGVYANQQNAASYVKKSPQVEAKAGEFHMSSQAQSFSETLRRIQDESDGVRMDKVSMLRQAIASGTYHVDANTLASDMLAMRY